MDTKKLNEMVEENIEAAQDEIGYELSEEDLELSRKIIAQLSGFYARKDQKATEHRNTKSRNRSAAKKAKSARRNNRK
jgi:hypothetical protein